jgi:hypothetical protein
MPVYQYGTEFVMKNLLTVTVMLMMGMAVISPVMAGGSSTAHLYPESPAQALKRSRNETYEGKAGTYRGEYEDSNMRNFYTLTIRYAATTPYVIKKSALINNPNYYYGPMNGSDTDTFFGFETGSSSHQFPERYLHQYALPTATKDPSVNETISNGKIRITYTLADGKTTVTKDIDVVFQRRNCEAYSNGRWQANAWEGGSPSGWIAK